MFPPTSLPLLQPLSVAVAAAPVGAVLSPQSLGLHPQEHFWPQSRGAGRLEPAEGERSWWAVASRPPHQM